MDLRSHLITDAQYFYQQGWMLGTAGNLSARLPDGSFWITASGRMKGALTLDDFVRVDADGRVEAPSGLKPSAETVIHQTLYQRFSESQACYHVHSVEANLVSRFEFTENIPLPPLEMLKGLGIWTENPQCMIAVFPNHLKVEQIAVAIAQRFAVEPPAVPALLIRDHGLTVWAPSTSSARNFVELLEYIFRYMVVTRQLKLGE
ncbi:MAG: methylthioribulose 1-phosphate dehydratase [Oscillatoriales cyanobacterium C42_A2020_001]|nr:methylthioribulose 1-phosphate dehydratase [Leptolyngbyaceae cyanobacterium C42_A2020_001]